MKGYNVVLEEGMGAFAETQKGIEKGRVKATGKYLCSSFKLQNSRSDAEVSDPEQSR